MANSHCYTAAQLDFLRANYPTMSRRVLTQALNNAFGLDKTVAQIKSAMKNHRITSGRSGRFVRGQVAWNHGEKGYMGPNATSFKKGSIPSNLKPFGAERLCSKDDYILIKIPEHNPYTGCSTRYKHKHVHVWELAHGPVPEGHCIFFRDGDRSNCDIKNLITVNRSELLLLNLHKYKSQPDELKPSVLALAKIEAKAGFRTTAKGRLKNREMSL